MKRSSIKRGKPLARKKPIAKRSKKTRDIYAREGGRRDVVARILSERPRCERCKRAESVHVHEVVTRAMGGSILDEMNLRALCAPCHSHIHEHPQESRASGWLGSRYTETT